MVWKPRAGKVEADPWLHILVYQMTPGQRETLSQIKMEDIWERTLKVYLWPTSSDKADHNYAHPPCSCVFVSMGTDTHMGTHITIYIHRKIKLKCHFKWMLLRHLICYHVIIGINNICPKWYGFYKSKKSQNSQNIPICILLELKYNQRIYSKSRLNLVTKLIVLGI